MKRGGFRGLLKELRETRPVFLVDQALENPYLRYGKAIARFSAKV